MNEDLAWAAGLFNGEGSVSIKKDGNSRSLEISMTQAYDPEVLHELANTIGGRVHGPRLDRGRPRWDWGTGGFLNVVEIVNKLWPRLSTRKQEQAATAITAVVRHRVLRGRYRDRR